MRIILLKEKGIKGINMYNQKKKSVLITGASHGIGRAMAIAFAEAGYNVLINYCSSEQAAKDLAKQLNRDNLTACIYQADVRKKQEVCDMVQYAIQAFGHLDVLINNAGIAQFRLFTDITEDEWDAMIDTHLKGTFHCAQAALQSMISEKYGKIINISSIWGLTGGSCEVHYSAAKAGIIGLTKALAKEVGPSNIQVNCIAPGVIETEMLADLTDEDMAALKEETPIGRIGQPTDVAKLALYLASDDSSVITGQVISPNGGFVI